MSRADRKPDPASDWKRHTHVTQSGRFVTPPRVYFERPEVKRNLELIKKSSFYKALPNRT